MPLSQSVKPVRPYKRFPKSMVADTGINPTGAFVDFVRKDPIIALSRQRDYQATVKDEIFVKIPIGKVPHGTTKCTYSKGLDLNAKLDREALGI